MWRSLGNDLRFLQEAVLLNKLRLKMNLDGVGCESIIGPLSFSAETTTLGTSSRGMY